MCEEIYVKAFCYYYTIFPTINYIILQTIEWYHMRNRNKESRWSLFSGKRSVVENSRNAKGCGVNDKTHVSSRMNLTWRTGPPNWCCIVEERKEKDKTKKRKNGLSSGKWMRLGCTETLVRSRSKFHFLHTLFSVILNYI